VRRRKTYREETFSHEKMRRFCLAEVRKKMPWSISHELKMGSCRSITYRQDIEAADDEEQPAADLGKSVAIVGEDLCSDSARPQLVLVFPCSGPCPSRR